MFQCGCSQLCALLEYCDLFTGFWSSYKSILLCVLLLSWCSFGGNQDKSFCYLAEITLPSHNIFNITAGLPCFKTQKQSNLKNCCSGLMYLVNIFLRVFLKHKRLKANTERETCFFFSLFVCCFFFQ